MKQLELLAPAGSLATLKAVVNAGADAVYLGGRLFGARAYADNLTKEELLEGINYCHLHGRSIYLTVNTLLKEQELNDRLYDYLSPYYEAGLDGVIVQDMGVVRFLQAVFPGLPIHASTQMTVVNADGARLLRNHGISRVVLARELSLEEIDRIYKVADVQLECFIHGALCYCYSGQCLMSSILGGRSGNRGRCAQPCRLPYAVYDASGEQLVSQSAPLLSLRDLCTVEQLYRLADCGVYSFKIEGRMKTPEYAAGVVSVYRKYMDSYLDGSRIPVSDSDFHTLTALGNRGGFTHGYLVKHNGRQMLSGKSASHIRAVGKVQEEIQKKYIRQEIKEKIYGNLSFSKGRPAIMEVGNDRYKVIWQGDIVEPAINQPLTREVVEEKIRRTGNTPFEFEDIKIKIGVNAFMPVNQLNEMRRDALYELMYAILLSYRRKPAARPPEDDGEDIAYDTLEDDYIEPRHVVSIEQPEYLDEVLACPWVDSVYLDSLGYERQDFLQRLSQDVCRIKKSGKTAYFIFPRVFRERTEHFYDEVIAGLKELPLDGFVVTSLDVLGYAKKHKLLHAGWDIVGECNLYTFTDTAADWFYDAGIQRDTFPAELNRPELHDRRQHRSEFIIYGRQHLMLSAQCVKKNTEGCSRNTGMMLLQDRMNIRFPVRYHCPDCYNVIYNSRPLNLLRESSVLLEYEPAAYRIAFTLEDAAQMRRILSIYEETMILRCPYDDLPMGEFTNGHFKRGVE